MSEPKTKPTKASVDAFLRGLDDQDRAKDCRAVLKIMRRATGSRAVMWGDGIVGLGKYHYKYKSGREGDWFLIGASPRKQDLTIYLMDGAQHHDKLLTKLGPHKTGKACLYLKRLADIDLAVLEKIIHQSVARMKKQAV